jgi:hypothetical protein
MREIILRCQVVLMFTVILIVSIFSPSMAIKLSIELSERTKQESNNAK